MADLPTLIIAGTHSGSGKTSLALALVRALSRRGIRVQTFKVGPDFLDPTYLSLASGRPCYNLDGWMAGREHVRGLFSRAAADADCAVVEGVMGMYDGADAASDAGSTAEIARWLDAPVLLVANVHGMGQSIAALVGGFTGFAPDIRFAGVVANHCGSERHAAWLSDALSAAGQPPLLGAIPRGAFPELSQRHLGLVTADRGLVPEALLDEFSAVLERHLPSERLFPGLARSADRSPVAPRPAQGREPAPPAARCTLGVARDAAFHFYYQALFDSLSAAGCAIRFFSPLADRRLPAGIDGLYLGGGYPEAHAAALAENREMLAAIRAFAASGKPLYAECGGLMYLSEGLLADGRFTPFLGILPARTRMLERKKALGYVEVTLAGDSLWGVCGATMRGHEFHYSELVGDPGADPGWQRVYRLRRRRAEAVEAEGFQKGAILASYTHLYHAASPAAIERFVNRLGGTP
ncbi:MAG: cobyrinate a,c-diamide synthase [Syntrophales bacterium]